jgi:hypothetical protein
MECNCGEQHITFIKKPYNSSKKVIRIITWAKYNAHTSSLFHKASILKLEDIYSVEVSKLVFKYRQGDLPTPLKSLFTLTSAIHTRMTRQHDDLYFKKCRTTLATQHISHKGPQIWNSLPFEIKTLTHGTLKSFTSKLTRYIINGYGTS